MSNASDFILLKEDHTLGNLLSAHLKQAPHVLMAGYKSKPSFSSSSIHILAFLNEPRN
jgi:DNA-directed RNA polymerase subunit L